MVLKKKTFDAAAADLFSSFGFTQLIDIPTRVTENTIALIDLIFESNTQTISSHGTLPKIADHDGVVVSYYLESHIPKTKTKIVFDYNKADINGLTEYITQFDFDNIIIQYPTIRQAELFTNVLADAFAKFIPSKTVSIRSCDQPWSNSYTRLLIRKKNTAKRNMSSAVCLPAMCKSSLFLRSSSLSSFIISRLPS